MADLLHLPDTSGWILKWLFKKPANKVFKRNLIITYTPDNNIAFTQHYSTKDQTPLEMRKNVIPKF